MKSRAHLRKRLGEQDEEDDAEQAADHAGDERDAERLAAAALLVHLVAVDRRGGGGVGAGRADQDRRDRAAIFRADIGRREEHDRGDRLHRVGEGQQQRHRDRRRDARQRAADDAPGDAGHRREHRRRGGQRLPAIGKTFHGLLIRGLLAGNPALTVQMPIIRPRSGHIPGGRPIPRKRTNRK